MVDEKSHQYALSCGYADDDFCGDDTQTVSAATMTVEIGKLQQPLDQK